MNNKSIGNSPATSLSVGGTAGIIVGCIFVAVIGIILFIYCRNRRRFKTVSDIPTENSNQKKVASSKNNLTAENNLMLDQVVIKRG